MFSRRRHSGLLLGLALLTTALASPRLAAQFWQADPGFAPTFQSNPGDPAIMALVRQPDGRIIAAGSLASVNGVPVDFMSAPPIRFNTDGSTDFSFHPAVSQVSTLYLQPDGKIIANGARLNADGSRDTTFNVSGAFHSAAAIDTTGRLYSANGDATFSRFTVDGELDPSFKFTGHLRLTSTDGVLIAPFADGTVAAYVYGQSYSQYIVTRLLADGSTDPAFHAVKDLPQTILGLIPLPDGRLLVYGTDFAQYNTVAMRFTRLTRDGSADYIYVAPSSFSSGPTPNDAFVLSGVIYDLLKDAGAPARYHQPAAISANVLSVIDVATDGTAMIASSGPAMNPTFARYARAASGDLTIDPRPTITLPISKGPFNILQGQPVTLTHAVGGLYPLTYQWLKDGVPISGATSAVFTVSTGHSIESGSYTLLASNPYGSVSTTPVLVTVDQTPQPIAFTQTPTDQTPAVGSRFFLLAAANGNPIPSFAWSFNGAPITSGIGYNSNATSGVSFPSFQPANAGIYTVVATNSSGTQQATAILGVASTQKVQGDAVVVGTDIHHPNGRIYDQVLLQGQAATITADPGKTTRLSYIDLTDDIMQVEFSGAGSLSVVLDPGTMSGPAAPLNYNQPDVRYMKGHASLVISGADDTTNVSVFTVGPITAVNQSLFRDDVNYEGVADLGYIAISSPSGTFGGVRTADAAYVGSQGFAGIYAPSVNFAGPVLIGDIDAAAQATPALLLGSGGDVRITGGTAEQANGEPIQVSGFTELQFVDGMTSQGQLLPAKNTPAHFENGGADVTDTLLGRH